MKKWLIGLALLVIVLFALSVDTDSVRTRSVGRFTLVEHVHTIRQPYLHIAESGGDVFLPIPYWNTEILSQSLVSEKDTVWSSTQPHHVNTSPDGHVAVVQSHNHDQPWRFVYASGRQIVVPAPSPDSLLPNEGHEYPFDYLRWANEGQDLILMAYTHGWRSVDRWPAQRPGEPPVKMTTYVRIWQISPRTGKSSVMSHCEMPHTDSPDWSGRGGGCDLVPKHP